MLPPSSFPPFSLTSSASSRSAYPSSATWFSSLAFIIGGSLWAWWRGFSLLLSNHAGANGARWLMCSFVLMVWIEKHDKRALPGGPNEKSERRDSSTSEHTSALHPLPHEDRVASAWRPSRNDTRSAIPLHGKKAVGELQESRWQIATIDNNHWSSTNGSSLEQLFTNFVLLLNEAFYRPLVGFCPFYPHERQISKIKTLLKLYSDKHKRKKLRRNYFGFPQKTWRYADVNMTQHVFWWWKLFFR